MIFNYTADFSHKDGTQNERKKRGSRKKNSFGQTMFTDMILK